MGKINKILNLTYEQKLQRERLNRIYDALTGLRIDHRFNLNCRADKHVKGVQQRVKRAIDALEETRP